MGVGPTVFHKTEWSMPNARTGQILFCKTNHSDSIKNFSETDIINMLEFLIDNISAMFGGRVFNRQSAYLWMPLLADLFLIRSNIPAAPAYGVYTSQLIRYARACLSYQAFLDRGLLLIRKLLKQGFILAKFKSSLRKDYGRHHDLVDCSGMSVSQITRDMFHLS